MTQVKTFKEYFYSEDQKEKITGVYVEFSPQDGSGTEQFSDKSMAPGPFISKLKGIIAAIPKATPSETEDELTESGGTFIIEFTINNVNYKGTFLSRDGDTIEEGDSVWEMQGQTENDEYSMPSSFDELIGIVKGIVT